jgi:hypothetical protein
MSAALTIRICYTAWLFVALLFGANLYSGEEADLDTPIVSPGVPIAKDIFYLLIVAVCLYLGRRVLLDRNMLFQSLLIAVFCVAAALRVYAGSGTLDVSYLKVFKNLLLYVAITLPFVHVIMGSGMGRDFIRCLHNAVLFSLLVSLVLFFSHPVQSYTGRLFGTYGNPNTAGFVAVCCVGLYYMLEPEERSRWRQIGTFLLSIAVLALSASFSAVIAFIALLPVMWIFQPSHGRYPVLLKTCVSVLFLFLMFRVGSALVSALFESSALVESIPFEARIASLLMEGRQHESITTRIDDFMQFINGECASTPFTATALFGCAPEVFIRMDSTVTSFGYHFGLLGLVVLLLIVLVPYLQYALLSRTLLKSPGARRLPPLMALLTVIVLFNMPIQHAFEIFPINFLFAALIAILMFELNGYRLYRRMYPENVPTH